MKVDGQLRTTAPHVWAIGDVADTPLQLAHVSFTEGIAVAERAAGIEVPDIDYVNIPKVTYCTPEMASVGLTEAPAREQGRDIVTEKLDFRAIGKANIVGEGGFVKIVAEADDGPVLGIHMIGPARDRPRRRGDAHHELAGGRRRGRRADPPAPDPVRGHRRGAPRAGRQVPAHGVRSHVATKYDPEPRRAKRPLPTSEDWLNARPPHCRLRQQCARQCRAYKAGRRATSSQRHLGHRDAL